MSIRLSSANGHSMMARVAAAARLMAIALAVSLIVVLLVLTAAALFILLAPLALVLAFLVSLSFRTAQTAPYASDIVIESDYIVVDEDRKDAR
jgi:hypothetical protein